jgi:hypothetical protein
MARKQDDDDATALTARELAGALGVTPQRVSQMAQAGEIRRRGPGRFDATHALLYRGGVNVLPADHRRNLSPDVIAAVGWLSLPRPGRRVSAADLAAFHGSATRWGLTRSQADGLLMAGAAVLGESAPGFPGAAA